MYKKTNSRRNFIKKSVAIPSIIILPRHVLGGKNFTSPNDKLDIAGASHQSIKILEIQREGKKVQKIGEFMLGSQITKGSLISNV